MRSLLLFCFIILCASITMAQQFNLGVSGGVNFTNLKGKDFNDTYDPKGMVRINFGFWSKYELSEALSVHVGLLYSQHGSQPENDDIFEEFRLSYLQVPVYAGYTFFSQDDIKLSGLFGGYLGLRMSTNTELSDYAKSNFGEFPKEYTNLVDLGLSAGVDVEVIKNVAIRLVYNYGIIKTYSPGLFEADIDFGSLENAHNRFVQASVLYYFYKQ